MQDANCFRDRLDELNPLSRVTADQRRSGVAARDGYTVLDQARPGGQADAWGYPMMPRRTRGGLAQRVTDGPRYSDDY
jgi:hypothetical protein